MARIIIFLILGFVIFIVYVRYLEQKTLFNPTKTITATPKDRNLAFEDVYFKSALFDLNGWFIPGAEDAATIIYMHGNAGCMSDRLDKIEMFHNLGLNVFIFDYRGYGNSQGISSETSLYRDAQAAYDFLIGRFEIEPDKIIAYGASLGGAVAIDVAIKRDFTVLIVDSTFTNAVDMAHSIYPMIPAAFISTKLDSAAKIKNVLIPKLFIHSPEDDLVPYALGEKLFKLAVGSKEFLKTKGEHNDAHWQDQEGFVKGIEKFLHKNNLLE